MVINIYEPCSDRPTERVAHHHRLRATETRLERSVPLVPGATKLIGLLEQLIREIYYVIRKPSWMERYSILIPVNCLPEDETFFLRGCFGAN